VRSRENARALTRSRAQDCSGSGQVPAEEGAGEEERDRAAGRLSRLSDL
jgi:hypothetical protein